MNIIDKLPYELSELIKEYMWGNIVSYKKRLNIIQCLPVYKKITLRPNPFCKIKNTITEIEDELYCPRCGEKTLFPFTKIMCSECEVNNPGLFYTNVYINNDLT